MPLDVTAENPVSGSEFRYLRIQTVWIGHEREEAEPFTFDDDPFDEEFGAPFFTLYGVEADGHKERIADRETYREAAALARKLAPGIWLPDLPGQGSPVQRP